MANKQRYSFEVVKEALIKAKGFISRAAEHIGCDQSTVRNYIKRYPKLDDVIKEQRETLLDFAESKLISAIDEGNLTAIIFFLKTQGRSRGYYEKIETNTSFSIDRNDIPKDVLDKLAYVEKTSKHTE